MKPVKMYWRIASVLFTYFAVGVTCFCAEDGSTIDFATKIQPIFAARCYKCHGPQKQESDFRLDVKDIALRGGDLGETSIIPGKSNESFLLKVVSDPDADVIMPPKGERLSGQEIELIRNWIDQGAIWPDKLSGAETLTTDHWSFQSVNAPRPPSTASEIWASNPIDAFIFAKLTKNQLAPSAEADRISLIRRIYLDMHGLPPTPDEVAQFQNDSDPFAYDKLVERALASPRYGERWARHWLDIVRFAESHGFETNQERPNAWPYRDFVIESLNDDKPYDQFVKEQIVGDALDADVATGFLVAGPYDVVKSPDINLTLMQRQDELADIVNTTGATFLGLTLGCARCHNHKFDPILQKDFYSMQAVFAGVKHGERPLRTTSSMEVAKRVEQLSTRISTINEEVSKFLSQLQLAPAVNPQENVERFEAVDAKYVRFTILATSSSEPCIDELEIFSANEPSRNLALASAGSQATSSSNLPGYEIHKLEHINDGKYGNSFSWISHESGGGWVQIELPVATPINRIAWGRDRQSKYSDRLATEYRIDVATHPDEWKTVASSERRLPLGKTSSSGLLDRLDELSVTDSNRARQLVDELTRLENQFSQLANPTMVYAGRFSQPGPTHRLYRGEPLQKREQVVPDALTVIGTLQLEVNASEQIRRIAIAEWIVDGKNPLTARVIVNRLWQYHFGTGIVSTSSDFGANGTRPSHPVLLDWLAAELIRSGWSLKHVHRLILTSATYRQASTINPNSASHNPQSVDSSNRLLWRFPPRRLEAEAIRDSILAVSGALDQRMGGPGFNVFDIQKETVRHFFPKESFGPAEWRRMIYMTKFRQEQDGTFGAFDCPDGSQTMPQRPVSTSPLQAFNLLNSSFTLQQADLFASRLTVAATESTQDQVRLAFALTLSRQPDESEIEGAAELIEQHGLNAFCRAMLNASEFVFMP